MNSEQEEQKKVREVIDTWLSATAKGDLQTVLDLMAEDVVFLIAGQPPMRGREAFATATRSALQHFRIEGKPDIQEIRIAGDYAFCWNYLSITMTPLKSDDGAASPMRRAGHILSVFRKESDGRWVLFRDANMVA